MKQTYNAAAQAAPHGVELRTAWPLSWCWWGHRPQQAVEPAFGARGAQLARASGIWTAVDGALCLDPAQRLTAAEMEAALASDCAEAADESESAAALELPYDGVLEAAALPGASRGRSKRRRGRWCAGGSRSAGGGSAKGR